MRYTQDIYFGLKNSQVSQLQQDLARDVAVYPEKLVTGYFGPLTLKAVQRFQAKYSIISSGGPSTTGYGRVGPRTRAKLNELYGAVSTGTTIIRTVGEKESSFLIQKINMDSVEGLWHDAYPIQMPGDGTPRTIRIGDNIGYACEGISEKLINIDFSGQKITFTKVVGQPTYGGCPICLAGSTFIDTPSGLTPVKDLQVGMAIWTLDKSNHRVFGVIQKTSRVPVSPTHQMVHLVLDDERELFVSPPHPTIDGRTVGDLNVNDLYDGARVVSSERVIYDDVATYDILPSGATGFYWANGILLNSTLD